MTVENLKLVEIIGDKLVSFAGLLLAAYTVRLFSDYLRYRLDRLGHGVLERWDNNDSATVGSGQGSSSKGADSQTGQGAN